MPPHQFLTLLPIVTANTTALIECLITNDRDAVGDSHGSKATALIECIITNDCDAIGDSHRSKAIALGETIFTNACDAISIVTK